MEAQRLLPPPPQIGLDVDNSEKSLLSPAPSDYQPQIVGASLMNLGNTCFLNAVLQCITHTVPLFEKLQSADHPSCKNGEFCALCALRSHVEQCLVLSGRVVAPTAFANNLSKLSSDFELGQQGDAHELLRCLLDGVHSCCLDPSSKDHPSPEEGSLVTQVFGGRLRSQLRCSDCGHCSDTFEPLLDLSLGIDNANTLTEALESFTKVEKMEEESKFTCGGCRGQVSMEKQFKLDKAPAVVALHLKRFKVNGLFIQKIEKHVNYELELDLKPFLSSEEVEDSVKYELYAVVVHMGRSQFYGHYISFIRSSPSAWYMMDDRKVMRVEEAEVLNKPAYILFYIKQGSAPWFSRFMELQKVAHPDVFNYTDTPTSVLDHFDRVISSPLVGEAGSSTDSFSESVLNEAERKPDQTPSGTSCLSWSNIYSAEKAPPEPIERQSPKRSILDKHGVDAIFRDENFDDEEEPILVPQVCMESKGSRKADTPASMTLRDVHMDASVKRLMRGMPSTRRAGLLTCISEQHQSVSKQSRVQRIQPHDKKRKIFYSQPEDSPIHRPISGCSLSPNSIRRGLF